MRLLLVLAVGVVGPWLTGCGQGDVEGTPGVGPNEALLTWEAPTTNADATVLTDLAGYRVYVGTATASYGPAIDVQNALTYKVTNLTRGLRYFFAVTAYDTSGNESVFSTEVFKDIAP